MIQAVVFDFDGLILDTETNEFKAWQHIYEQHNAELTRELWCQCIGTDASAFDPYAHLEQCTGTIIDRRQIQLHKKQLVTELMLNEELRPGVMDYLANAKAMGLRIGLASSSKLEWISGYLKQHRLLEYFQCIRTSDNVAKVKPDPELYVQTLQCLGIEPLHAIAFEDSPNGSLAAKRAGMYCVIVPNEMTRDLVFGAVDMRIESMQQIELREVIAGLERER